MVHRKKVEFISAALGMMVLILDSKTALRGAEQGIDLCINTIIPSLFPFIFLSCILSSNQPEGQNWFGDVTSLLFRIPKGLSPILFPAFLGGYPVGAQSVYDTYQSGLIDHRSAEYLLAYCSNIGPAFLFGVLPLKFTSLKTVFHIWILQILSAWSTCQLMGKKIQIQKKLKIRKHKDAPLDTAIKAISRICGWIFLFRILISFLERWFLWMIPDPLRIFLIGALELSNGCSMLQQIVNEEVRFIIANALLSFGGVCVVFQTVSICPTLRIHYYLCGKIVQAVISCIMAICVLKRMWYALLLWVIILGITRRVAEKKSSNLTPVVV